MQIVFSDDDLARVRVWTRLDVIAEMMYASRPWPAPDRMATLGGWSKRTVTGLGPLGAPVLQDVRSNLFQFISGGCPTLHAGLALGMFPDDADLDELVDDVLALPTRHWTDMIGHHRGLLGDPSRRGAGSRPDTRAAIGEALRHFHRVALRPYWDQLNALTSVITAGWMHTLASRGLEALFAEFHPGVSWHQSTLSVAVAGPEVCHPRCFAHHMTDNEDAVVERMPASGRGLTIMPTVFNRGCGIWADFDHVNGYSAYCLAVPLPVTWEWFETGVPIGARDALGELPGPTRSWVLQACADAERSTSRLARAVGISISSASEHAAVLRAAGPVRSERRGNTVVHSITPVGEVLMHSTMAPRSRVRSSAAGVVASS